MFECIPPIIYTNVYENVSLVFKSFQDIIIFRLEDIILICGDVNSPDPDVKWVIDHDNNNVSLCIVKMEKSISFV